MKEVQTKRRKLIQINVICLWMIETVVFIGNAYYSHTNGMPKDMMEIYGRADQTERILLNIHILLLGIIAFVSYIWIKKDPIRWKNEYETGLKGQFQISSLVFSVIIVILLIFILISNIL